jgi:UDP-N-acetylglucosamine 2-epimerase (non-hydrolysing)
MPEAMSQVGGSQLVGNDPARTLAAYRRIRSGEAGRGGTPPLWDGRAAARIVAILERAL